MKFHKVIALVVSACVMYQTAYSATPAMIARLREMKAAEKAAAAAAAAVDEEGGAYGAPAVMAPAVAAAPPAVATARRAAAPPAIAAAAAVGRRSAVAGGGAYAAPAVRRGGGASSVPSVDAMVRTLNSLPDDLHDESLEQMLEGSGSEAAVALREAVLARLAKPAAMASAVAAAAPVRLPAARRPVTAAAGGAGVDTWTAKAAPATRAEEAKREEEARSNECSICYSVLDDGTDFFVHKVGAGQHSIHVHCLDRCFEKESLCPMCRQPLTKAVVSAEVARVKAEKLKAEEAAARRPVVAPLAPTAAVAGGGAYGAPTPAAAAAKVGRFPVAVASAGGGVAAATTVGTTVVSDLDAAIADAIRAVNAAARVRGGVAPK